MKKLFLFLGTALTAALPALAADKPAADNCDMECCTDGAECSGLVSQYSKVSAALAADDLKTAQQAAADLECCLKCAGEAELAGKVASFSKAGTIADARNAFKAISAAVIPLAEKSGEGHFVMTCPMAGADWIQTEAELANPYYGAQMLRCGSVKKTVKAKS